MDERSGANDLEHVGKAAERVLDNIIKFPKPVEREVGLCEISTPNFMWAEDANLSEDFLKEHINDYLESVRNYLWEIFEEE